MSSPQGLCYLATPYTKYRTGNLFEAYTEACRIAGQLIRMGIRVYSPISHTHSIGVWGELPLDDHSLWMPFDAIMMEKADCLIVARMEGWQESLRMHEEIAYFTQRKNRFRPLSRQADHDRAQARASPARAARGHLGK